MALTTYPRCRSVEQNIHVVAGEISAVVGAIKRNCSWSTHTPSGEEQDPLLNSFGQLQEILNNIKTLSDVEPSVFLRPFLEVLRLANSTGPIAGLALTSVLKFMSYGLVDVNHEAAPEAIENMADAVTHARFHGTDPASDEVVLLTILQVLRTLLLSPVGVHLTNESVCGIMRSCFHICFETRLSQLLRKSAELTLVGMVQLLFSRLSQFKEETNNVVGANMKFRSAWMSESSKRKRYRRLLWLPHHTVKYPAYKIEQTQPTLLHNNLSFLHQGSSTPSPTWIRRSDSAASSISSPSITASDQDTWSRDSSREDLIDPERSSSASRLKAQSRGKQVEHVCSASVESIPEVREDRESVTGQSDSSSVHDMDCINPRDRASLMPYGLPCLWEVFNFLISLINPHDRHNTPNMIDIGLQLLIVALESANITNYQSLMGLVKGELCKHLFQLLSVEHINLYPASLRVCFLLFESMREHLKFQLEMYLKKLMAIIMSEKTPYEVKEMTLIALLQLWRIPNFVTELYINYDCDFCSNLFEDLINVLSKNASPVSGTLYTMHLRSLEALLIVNDSLANHCQNKVLNSAILPDHSEIPLAEWEGLTLNGKLSAATVLGHSANWQYAPGAGSAVLGPPTSRHLMYNEKMRLGSQDQEETYTPGKKAPTKPQRFSSCFPDSQELTNIKIKKNWLISGIEQFNQEPKIGIQFLQEKGLLHNPMDNNQVALWLRENLQIDKKMIGEFISDCENKDLLVSFVGTFAFQGLRIDKALRLYLEAFRLPGEAPLIHRLLETFTDNWHKANGCPFMTNDAAFTLAYAVIMLNTDQHNHNVRKLHTPMTVEQFKNNLKGLNGDEDFDQNMLEGIYYAIKNEEIVLPDEQTGLVKDNYLWRLLLHRSATPEGIFLLVPVRTYDRDLFTVTWGPTIAALDHVFDKSFDDTIIQMCIDGFKKCALISAHYGFSDALDDLIITLCKFTSLSNECSVKNLPSVFGRNEKAQVALKNVFHLVHCHGGILRHGWKNIIDCMLQLFRAELLPIALVEAEDFVAPNGKISLKREEMPSHHNQSAVASFVNWLTLSGVEPSGRTEPSTEDLEAMQAAILCVRQCDPEMLITESKGLQVESLQELVKALISVSPRSDKNYDEEDTAFCLEMLLRIVLENSYRVLCVWKTVQDHLYHLCVCANQSSFLVERAVVGLLRLASCLLQQEDIRTQVLVSLRLLLRMTPVTGVLSQVRLEVAYGLHQLIKTNSASIYCTDDWYTLFTLLECIGAGVKPLTLSQLENPISQADGELSSHHSCVVSLKAPNPGCTSNSEVHSQSRISHCSTYMDVESSRSLVVPKDVPGVAMGQGQVASTKDLMHYPLVNQHSSTLDQELDQHDVKSFIKCVETLSFIVHDVALINADNLKLCVKTVLVFVEGGRNGGYHGNGNKRQNSSKPLRKKGGWWEKECGGTLWGGSRARSQCSTPSHSDDDEPASDHTVTLQLLDLMHVLHTRAASVYCSRAEEHCHHESAGRHAVQKIETGSQTLWTGCWSPLLQGIVSLCCDSRCQVRMQALDYLENALLNDLKMLDATQWESCFKEVLNPLLTKLHENFSPTDVGGMEETRMRVCTLMSNVCTLLSPLLSLPKFASLWRNILNIMVKYMHPNSSDLLTESISKSLKDMLQLYRQDCETFGTVVKMLANKEPALEQMLMAPLKENLLEIKQRCLDDLSHFIKELDQAMELDQAAQPSEVISV